jgi:hypothetical protein
MIDGNPTDLEALLAQAREADPADRINLRDPIAAHGELAIDAMTDWLGDARLAAFAIRVLERIGRQPELRPAVVDVLGNVDCPEMPEYLARDIDQALQQLGVSKTSSTRRVRPLGRPAGRPGVPGRGYWVMRTSPWERPYIWAESQRGRLRQGWGWNPEMSLDTIADLVRRGGDLSDEQRMAWRSRRMRTSEQDGMRVGDLVVSPNIPDWGRLSVYRVTGSYEYSMDAPRKFDERFGHVLPVELVVASIDRRAPIVSDGLRAMLRPQSRLYNISGYGGDVERLIGGQDSTNREGTLWLEAEYERLFGLFPPTGPRPTEAEIQALAAELGRTHDAIAWQWADGAAYCRGGAASTTSEPLKAWLDRAGMCG